MKLNRTELVPGFLTFDLSCRYVDTFRRASLLLAGDFAHLDHDALVSLGISATGHRKRILRLVDHIQRAEAQRANQGSDISSESCQLGSDAIPLHRSSLDLAGMLRSSDSSQTPPKPVPKPRTVFNRRRTAPVHFCTSPDPVPPTLPRRLSQESICFSVLETLNSEYMATHDRVVASEVPPSPGRSQRLRQAGVTRTRPGRSLSLSDTRALVPPVPPRLNRDAPSSEQKQAPSPHGSMEMVSNEIYWGSSPTPPYCSQQSAPPEPGPDLNRERNR